MCLVGLPSPGRERAQGEECAARRAARRERVLARIRSFESLRTLVRAEQAPLLRRVVASIAPWWISPLPLGRGCRVRVVPLNERQDASAIYVDQAPSTGHDLAQKLHSAV